MIEAFSNHESEPSSGPIDRHIDLNTLRDNIPSLCNRREISEEYNPVDCVHGMGHAIMDLSGYDIERSMEYCNLFATDGMRHYWATGAYMEYILKYHKRDSKNQSLFYPCDRNQYPAACFRYKLRYVIAEHYRNKGRFTDILEKCMQLSGNTRLGCFYGLGHAHTIKIRRGQASIADICLNGTPDDQQMCIEGGHRDNIEIPP